MKAPLRRQSDSSMADNRLLILGCSSRKIDNSDPVPAWELYDGVFFRVAKKVLGSALPINAPCVRILSAKFGLIEPQTMIEYYDERMCFGSAQLHREACIEKLTTLCRSASFASALVICGKDYIAALSPISLWAPPSLPVEIPPGGIGKKLQRLKHWLLLGTDIRPTAET